MDELWLQYAKDLRAFLCRNILVYVKRLKGAKRVCNHLLGEEAKLQGVRRRRINKDRSTIQFIPALIIAHFCIHINVHLSFLVASMVLLWAQNSLGPACKSLPSWNDLRRLRSYSNLRSLSNMIS